MKTPRTDAIANYGHINGKSYSVLESDELVPADFARDMEIRLVESAKIMNQLCLLMRDKIDVKSVELEALAHSWLHQHTKSYQK